MGLKLTLLFQDRALVDQRSPRMVFPSLNPSLSKTRSRTSEQSENTSTRPVASAQYGADTAIRLVQDVASKTNDNAGDGTTTATVLARAIYSEGVKNVAAGCNPMDLRRGSQKAVDKVLEVLESQKRSITTSEEIAQVSLP